MSDNKPEKPGLLRLRIYAAKNDLRSVRIELNGQRIEHAVKELRVEMSASRPLMEATLTILVYPDIDLPSEIITTIQEHRLDILP